MFYFLQTQLYQTRNGRGKSKTSPKRYSQIGNIKQSILHRTNRSSSGDASTHAQQAARELWGPYRPDRRVRYAQRAAHRAVPVQLPVQHLAAHGRGRVYRRLVVGLPPSVSPSLCVATLVWRPCVATRCCCCAHTYVSSESSRPPYALIAPIPRGPSAKSTYEVAACCGGSPRFGDEGAGPETAAVGAVG